MEIVVASFAEARASVDVLTVALTGKINPMPLATRRCRTAWINPIAASLVDCRHGDQSDALDQSQFRFAIQCRDRDSVRISLWF